MASTKHKRFKTTQWSLVVRTNASDPEESRKALEALLHIYWRPLLVHLVSTKRLSRDAAEDVLQGFIADKVLERELFAKASQSRGRLRTLLLTALDHYYKDRFRRDTAQKRFAPRPKNPTNLADVASDTPRPGDSYDVAWARTVLEQAVELMREECAEMKRPEIWEVFEVRVLKPTLEQTAPTPYASLMNLGFKSPSRAAEGLYLAKQVFRACLRKVVEQYVVDPNDIEDEVLELKRLLAKKCNA